MIYLLRSLLLLILMAGCCLPATAQLSGTVVAIADGDTFTLLTADKTQVKIRLHGIDCPEKKQPYATQAKNFVSDRIFGRQVTVSQKGKDRYKRIIGIVYTDDGSNLNEALLMEGLAWHFTKYDTNTSWAAMESTARKRKIGLWKDRNAIAPWIWRTNH